MLQKQINATASQNRAAELKKLNAYFVEHGISTITFTDTELSDPDAVFRQMARYLGPPSPRKNQVAEVMARLKSRA